MEETAEFIEAVNDGDFDHMCEELGDVLLQVALHAEIAAERGDFNMYDVIKGISEKMIRRHPHVFGNANVDDADDVSKNWEAIKAAEKRANGEKTEAVALSDLIPPTFPTLSQAFVLQKEAGKAGFDWENIEPVVGKVKEELNECLHADRDEVELELGDLLFSVVNLSRFLRVDPEQALRRACHKFTKRFAHMRQAAGAQWDGMTLDEMEPLWQKAKQKDTH